MSNYRFPPMVTRPHPLWHVPSLNKDPLGFVQRAHERYGDTFTISVLGSRNVVSRDPGFIHAVLVDQQAVCPRSVPTSRAVARFLGDENIFTSDGPIWRVGRTVVNPAFGQGITDTLRCAMAASIGRVLDRFAAENDGQTPQDVFGLASAIALEVVGTTLFGAEGVGGSNSRIVAAVNECMAQVFADFRIPEFARTLWPPRKRRFDAAMAYLGSIINPVIAAERASPGSCGAPLLTRLIAEGEKQKWTAQQYHDHCLTFLAAGFETTATALTWAVYEIARNPQFDERLGKADDPFIGKLIFETLRYYPPAWMTGRGTVGELKYGDWLIPPGVNIAINIFGLHHRPSTWSDPDGFNPDRFNQKPPEGSYAPFLMGQHRCIGERLAMAELTMAIHAIHERFSLVWPLGQMVEMKAGFTLRPSPFGVVFRER